MQGSRPRTLRVALVASLIGLVAGPVCLLLASAAGPDVVLTTERELPSFARGFYPVERGGGRTFAWTTGRADIVLAGLDRRHAWECTVRFRGARADATTPQPDVEFAIDGVSATRVRARNEFQDVMVTAPARPSRPGLTLSLSVSPTFVPGPADTRALGVQVEHAGCRPASRLVVPPGRALRWAALSAAALGLALGAAVPAGWAAAAILAVSAVQAWPLSSGGAMFGTFPAVAGRFAVWIAFAVLAALAVGGLPRRRPLGTAAGVAIACSGAAVYLELLALLHPSKDLVDAVFHAHRFEAVLAGRFYFTQLSTSATPFPYAIGLYLFAAPWAVLTDDHVALLRVVVVAAAAVAGGLLYPMIVLAWRDRMAAATAVVLSHLVPVVYLVVGNANLTNAFGASAALATVAVATLAASGGSVALVAAGLLATLAFISHVSTVTLLPPVLLAMALLYRLMGGASFARPARRLVAVILAAGACSVVLYWGHFGSLYAAQLARMRTAPAVQAEPLDQTRVPEPEPAAAATAPASARPLRLLEAGASLLGGGQIGPPPGLGTSRIPFARRVRDAAVQTVHNFGWPLLLLAGVGACRLRAARDAAAAAVAAWLLVGVAFVALSVVSAGEMRYQQDAWEFIGRVEHLCAPAIAVLAAVGAAWTWSRGLGGRVAAAVLLAASIVPAARLWQSWF